MLLGRAILSRLVPVIQKHAEENTDNHDQYFDDDREPILLADTFS